MRGRVDRAAGAEGLAAGLTIRPIDVGDEVGLGMLMAVAYRGTIDDPGEDDAWFQADARATLQGGYGVLLEDASVVAVDEEGLVGTCVVTNDASAAGVRVGRAGVAEPWRGHCVDRCKRQRVAGARIPGVDVGRNRGQPGAAAV